MNPECGAEGDDERHDDDNRGENLHQPADHEEKQVENEQERQPRVDVPAHPIHQTHRYLRADHVVGEADGDAEDHEHASDDRDTLADNPQEIPLDQQVAVNHRLHQQRVARRQRGGFDSGRNSTEHRNEHDRRHCQLPLPFPEGRARLPEIEAVPARPRDDPFADAPPGDHAREQNPGQDAADEKIFDRDLRDDPVENQRERWWEQQAERSRCREKPEREALAVTVSEQRWEEHAAQRQNRHSRPARKCREEGTENRAYDRGSAWNPSEDRAKDAQQPFRRSAFGKDEARQREQRNRWQCRRHAERVGFDKDRSRRDAVAHEQQRRRGSENRENRRAEHGRDRDECQAGPCRTACKQRGIAHDGDGDENSDRC